jgi:rod shape-determining protein MreD
MRWITFLLLLYVMTAMQCAKFAAFPSGPHGDNFFPEILYIPMLALFYALFAADPLAPLAALACGAIMDLTNGDFLGTSAIPLALVAWMLVRTRPSLFREHMMLQMIMTLLAMLAYALLDAIFRSLLHAPLTGLTIPSHFLHLAGDAVYTAVAAPLFFWIFFRFQPLLGFTPHGPRGRGHG